jgi:septal ring factor EnvC (AmiA/AmiB activator)
MSEFKEVITLLTLQEERLVNKINEVHTDVRETRDDVKKINGRLRKAEQDISGVKATCGERRDYINEKLAEVKPAASVSKVIQWVQKHPKITILLSLMVLVAIQTTVMMAVEHEWIGKLIEKLF